jgi:DNA ligase (NAD+)
MSGSVADFFKSAHNRRVIERLGAAGVVMTQARPAGSQKLAGRTYVLTGTLKDFTRDAAEAKILALGGRVSSSVSKKTEAVIAGEAPGSKLKDAEKLGVTILSEAEFKKLIG